MYFRFPTSSPTPTPYDMSFSYLYTDEDIHRQTQQALERDDQRRRRRESRQSRSSKASSDSSKRASFLGTFSHPSQRYSNNSGANPPSIRSTSIYSTEIDTLRQSTPKRYSTNFFRSDAPSESSDITRPWTPKRRSKRFSDRLSGIFDALGNQSPALLAAATAAATHRESVMYGFGAQ
jgi:hypothetical protein